MKIEVSLNPKSIKEAIERVKRVKSLIPKMEQDLILEVAKWIAVRANRYIDLSEIGSMVKNEIKGGWQYIPFDGGVKVINQTPKAVFVEFGVGIVGKGDPHPNASAEGYEYNKPRSYVGAEGRVISTKDERGMWYFWTNGNELDIPLTAVEDIRGFDDFRGKKGKRIVVGTRGTKGVWYAYNAILDAKIELSKPNGGEIGKLWDDIKKRYIG